MSVLDRALQRQILEELADEYPDLIDFEQREYCRGKKFQANLFYLREHGLINGHRSPVMGEWSGPSIATATITKTGLDFLAEDGGLSAILNIVTVQFNVNNVRTILEDKIVASHLSKEQKETFLTKVKSLSGEMMKETVMKVFEKALEHPEIWPVLMKSMGL